MDAKKKGLLQIGLILAIIAVFAGIIAVGIGKGHRGSMKNIHLGLDLAGGVSITYQTVKENPTSEQMKDTVYKIQKRVQDLNTEAVVYQEGSNRINVDIPGVTDANEILAQLGKAGSIEFIDPEGNVVIDGSHIVNAEALIHEGTVGNEFVVSLKLNAAGTKKFAEATEKNIGKQIGIVYDNELISMPTVSVAITNGEAQITGQSTFDEAQQLASTIRIGALPLELKELRSNVVGAKLGAEAVSTSLVAGLIGFIAVIIFMIAFYRVPGLASSIALILYVAMMLLILNGLNVTLTLPGIAGIILSIGMAVDANVIIFTRIKEELAAGKTVRSAIKLGFNKALSAIIDGNVTTLIAAAVLWVKGSGTVKGFSQTLAIGIVLSMFTALFVTKFIVNTFYSLGVDEEKYYGVQKERKAIPFVKNTLKYFLLSGLLIVIGVGFMFFNKSSIGDYFNFGLDFKGGTSTEVTFREPIDGTVQPAIIDMVKGVIGESPEVNEVKEQNSIIIKTKELNLEQRTEIADKLVTDFGVEDGDIATESISGVVSKEMTTDAVTAVAISAVCMLIYIWIRFKDINFGAGAVLALLHDVVIVILVYAVTRISVGNTFIACILTILGYSINATIVIFDRIRENKAVMRGKDTMQDVVDRSITQTISRSINTSLTTFIMVFFLWLLGVESIRDFTLPLMAGIICGAYSSICISGTLWYALRTKFGKKVKA